MSKGKISLQEIMGKDGAAKSKERALTVGDLPSLLGDGMPKLDFNQVGRIRMMRALKQRFGNGFRNVPGISGIIKDFDDETRFSLNIKRMKQIKGKV